MNVVNRHPTESIALDLELEDKQFAGPVEIFAVNGPDIKSQNDFGTTSVKTTRHSGRAEGRKFTVNLPAHSYSMLKAELV